MIPLHPKIVHFPVALLISAAIFGVLAFIIKNKRETFKEILYWNLLLGGLSAVFAIITGLIEEATLVHNEAIHSLMETHEALGFVFTGIFLSLGVWMTIRKSKLKSKEFSAIVIILILTAVIMGYSAHLGGRMVYEQGAGVVPMKEIIEHEEGGHHHHHDGEENTEHDDDDNHEHSGHHDD